LRLQDWDVKIRFSREEEVGGDGRTDFNKQLKTATIQIVEEATFHTGVWKYTWDPEQILVHELLHLHFTEADFSEHGSPRYISLEQGIDLTAWALVRAKRG